MLGTDESECEKCRGVLASQAVCRCTHSCGVRCWYIEPDTYIPPPVPKFEKRKYDHSR